MIQHQFAAQVRDVLAKDPKIIGLAVGGSWLSNEIDQFSDLDLIVVSKELISNSKDEMLDYAKRFGDFLSGCTGEHVGEPRVLICLYDNPLLHVDIKFLTLKEFSVRIETPAILLDKENQLERVLQNSSLKFPYPDYQWIEDRFWVWVHYALLKIGRGEYLEAYDFLGFLRMVVFGPLLHIKNNNLPRGVRKVETALPEGDLQSLIETIPNYDRSSLLHSLKNGIELYRKLRDLLYDDKIVLQLQTEQKVLEYYDKILKQ